MILNLERFVLQEEPYWNNLEAILRPYETDRFHKPSLEEALRLFDLYERCVADLARLQDAAQPELSAYLESIVGRAYAQIHSARGRKRFRFKHWLWHTLPATFRRQRRAFAIAVLLTVVGTATGSVLMAIDNNAKETLMPFSGLLEDPAKRVQEEEKSRGKRMAGHQASFSAMLITHNTNVAFFSLACGMTFGIGTVLLLFYNGIALGAVCYDYIHAGQLQFLLGWLLPHGVVEIPAILVASQAGLVLASALIGWNSRLSRTERLRAVSADVMTLGAGAALMLIWAGLIEAYISQYHAPVLPYGAKISFGIFEFVLLALYFLRAGRSIPVPKNTDAA